MKIPDVVPGHWFHIRWPLFGADHRIRDVEVAAHAEAVGLCEKAGAVPLWVILDDVPDDYRVGFLLSSFGP